MVAYLVTSSATASRLSARPRLVGNSGSPGSPARSRIQAASTFAVERVRGVDRCLRPLPGAANVGSASELGVLAGEPAQFGDPHPRLDGDGEQRVVAAAGPAVPVRGSKEGAGLEALQ